MTSGVAGGPRGRVRVGKTGREILRGLLPIIAVSVLLCVSVKKIKAVCLCNCYMPACLPLPCFAVVPCLGRRRGHRFTPHLSKVVASWSWRYRPRLIGGNRIFFCKLYLPVLVVCTWLMGRVLQGPVSEAKHGCAVRGFFSFFRNRLAVPVVFKLPFVLLNRFCRR